MISLLKLIRYKNLCMVLLTVVLSKYVIPQPTNGSFFTLPFISLLLAVLCITAGGYIINDIYDVVTDAINKPAKCYVGKSISVKTAWMYYVLCSSIGLAIGLLTAIFYAHIWLFGFFVATLIALFTYARYLKKMALLGNLLVSFLAALTLLLVFLFESTSPTDTVLQNLNAFAKSPISWFAYFAFTMTFLREVVKDIEDLNGDHAQQMYTLPILLGIRRTKNLLLFVSVFVLLGMLTLLKSLQEIQPLLFGYGLLCLALPFGFYLYRLYQATSIKNFQFLSRLLKGIMLLGILSMLLLKL